MSKNNEKTGGKILDEIFEKLDLKSIIDTAIFSAISGDAKDALLKNVMSYLSSRSDNYGSSTILEDAFKTAIRPALQERMHKIISEDAAVMAEIDRVVKEATQKFIGMDKEKLIENLVSTMHRAFEKDY